MSHAKNQSATQPLSGSVLEEEGELTLAQLCEACATDAEWIVELVHEGVLDPHGRESTRWRFSALSLRRVQVTLRLQRDLEVNLPGAGLILDLMDEIETLRNRINSHRVAAPPDPEGGSE